ncbi:trypsin-like peptidase domain-containing protein [Myxococcus sp. CA051A]|uniref:serine protease n=1 Tax=Myxococcus sp. CA051A TaxID=2741739 RepID=UPI00157AD4D8|nr:serine protease [Myxococcus sp. CA051A]NTX62116.1 trypsin-like peptidase domain-containing protein [Myxococcus sp. CA051A]
MKRIQLAGLVAALTLSAPAALASAPVCKAAASPASQRATKVGEDVYRRFESAHPYATAELRRQSGPLHTDVITHPGAAYIAAHFERLELEEGDFVVVRSPDGTRSRRYDGSHPGARDGFWAMHIPGDTAIVELHGTDSPGRRGILNQHGYSIDRFARGYTNAEQGFTSELNKALCGVDDSGWAPCYATSEPTLYGRARPVARLLIGGSSACTGWLVGSQGHILTNQHCIGTASDAQNTDFEFMAEGATCATSCGSWFGCPGHVISGGTLVQADAPRDYALVRLAVNPTNSFGYLQMRGAGAVVNERIYIPQHPAGYGKKIAVTSTDSTDESGFAEVYSLNEASCQSGGPNDVGYFADTQGGSSGSPVVGYSDHLVVSLHHCANCPNRGVPIQAVVSHLGANLPQCALPTAGCPDPNGNGEPPPEEPPPPANSFTYTATNTNNAQQNTTNKKLALTAGQQLTVATCGLTGAKTTGDTYMRLFNPAGTSVATNDDACGGRGSSITFTATTAGEYEVRAGCYSTGSCGGTVVWEISGGNPPPATSGSFAFSGSNTNSAQQATTNRDLTVTAGQVLTVATCGATGASFTGDTYLRLFSGATQSAANDDACSGRGSSLSFTATTSGTLQIRAGCYSNTTCSGTVVWNIQ